MTELQVIINKVNMATNEFGLKMNLMKTKLLINDFL